MIIMITVHHFCQINVLGVRRSRNTLTLSMLTIFLHAICVNYSEGTFPPPEVNLCLGDEMTLTCSTSEAFLQWSITNVQTSVSRLVSFQGEARELEPLSLSSISFYISKASDNEVVPLVSTISVYNVTTDLNTTAVSCSEIARNGQIERISMTIIHIIEADPFPPERVTVFSESFWRYSVFVKLTWSPVINVSYSITVMPMDTTPGPMLVMNNSVHVQLRLNYNVLYNVSVTATLCRKQSTPTHIALKYGKCELDDLIASMNDSLKIMGYEEPTLEGTVVNFTCPTGMVLNGPISASTCMGNGEWEPDPRELKCKVDCGVPMTECRVNLNYTSTLEDSHLTFSCEDGFVPYAIFTSVCRNASWDPNPSQHTCATPLSANCGLPSSLMSGFISPYTSTVEGARVKFACHLSPDPEEGLKTTICNQNGAWEPNPIDICETSQRCSNCSSLGLSHDVVIIAIASSITGFIVSSVIFFCFGYVCHWTYSTHKNNRQRPQETECHYATVKVCSGHDLGVRNPIYEHALPREQEKREVNWEENLAYATVSITNH